MCSCIPFSCLTGSHFPNTSAVTHALLFPLCHKETDHTLHEWWILKFSQTKFPTFICITAQQQIHLQQNPHQQDLSNNHHQQYLLNTARPCAHSKLWSVFWQMVDFLPTLNALSTGSCSSGYSSLKSTGVYKVFVNNSL